MLVPSQKVFSGHGTQRVLTSELSLGIYPAVHRQSSMDVAVVKPAEICVLGGHCVRVTPSAQFLFLSMRFHCL